MLFFIFIFIVVVRAVLQDTIAALLAPHSHCVLRLFSLVNLLYIFVRCTTARREPFISVSENKKCTVCLLYEVKTTKLRLNGKRSEKATTKKARAYVIHTLCTNTFKCTHTHKSIHCRRSSFSCLYFRLVHCSFSLSSAATLFCDIQVESFHFTEQKHRMESTKWTDRRQKRKKKQHFSAWYMNSLAYENVWLLYVKRRNRIGQCTIVDAYVCMCESKCMCVMC